MAFTLPLIAALVGGSLVSQVPLQVQPYRGGSEEESSAEEPRPEAENDSVDNDCDGAIDEGLSCDSGGCQAGGSGRGDVWLWLLGLALLAGIRRARTARFL